MSVITLILWVAFGGFGGWYLSGSYKKRVEILQEMTDFISDFEVAITQFGRSVSQFLKEFNFKTTLQKVAFKKEYKDKFLTQKESEEFVRLLEEIPEDERLTAIKKLQSFKLQCEKVLEIAQDENIKKGMMMQKLGVLFGLLVGILWL